MSETTKSNEGVPVSEPRPGPYGEDGVDVTLIREMLSLTPEERLEHLRQSLVALDSLRRAFHAD